MDIEKIETHIECDSCGEKYRVQLDPASRLYRDLADMVDDEARCPCCGSSLLADDCDDCGRTREDSRVREGRMSSNGINRRETDSRELYDLTTKIARQHGCDRGTFSVCWAEYERGETCRCREDAKKQTGSSEGGMWRLINDETPRDRLIIVYAPARHGLPEIVALCQWYDAAGFTVCELREPTHWMEYRAP